MKRINIDEAELNFFKLVTQVEKEGETLVILRDEQPIADVIPHRCEKSALDQDPLLAKARFLNDPCAPLDESDWPNSLR